MESYQDNFFDRLFIRLFSRKIARASGGKTQLSGYAGFVDLSQQIVQGRNAPEQQAVVAKVLDSLMPAPILWLIRTLFSPTQIVCELNAWFATQLFEWLVGPCEVRTVEVPDDIGGMRAQQSGVHIKKCRYLEESRCVGTCTNLCKLPTQEFFTKGFGIPLTMTPNFEDYSCEMVFGQAPPPFEAEALYSQPCLAQECPTAASSRPVTSPCPKIREGA